MIKPVRTPNRSNIAPNNKEPIPWIIEKNDFKLAYVVDNDAFSFSEDVLPVPLNSSGMSVLQ